MNQRIKELAKGAAVVYQKTLPPATHTTPLYLIDKLGKDAKAGGIEIVSDGFCEKFAELIVRECIALCKSMDETDTRYRYDYRCGVLDCVDIIKEHFGVEE